MVVTRTLIVFGIFPADWARQLGPPALLGLSAPLLTGLRAAPLARLPRHRPRPAGGRPARPRPPSFGAGAAAPPPCAARPRELGAARLAPAVRRREPGREAPPGEGEAQACPPSPSVGPLRGSLGRGAGLVAAARQGESRGGGGVPHPWHWVPEKAPDSEAYLHAGCR